MQSRSPLAGSAGLLSVLAVLALTAAGSAYVVLMPDASVASDPLATVPERPSRVGTMPYDGPLTSAEVLAACPDGTNAQRILCWTDTLSALLEGKGAGLAFEVLEQMAAQDTFVSGQSHAIAHGLGRYAYDAYGSIGLALTECSYKVFGGCVHGALQSYFDSLGHAVGPRDIDTVCPDDNAFTQYTCLHGLGHGLLLNLEYDLNASAGLCQTMGTWFERENCYGGVFMENWVGYLDSISATAAGGHDDGHEHPVPMFHIRAEDPMYPCNAIPDAWAQGCWIMQTSVMLYFNHNDFVAAANVCGQVEKELFRDTCFKSLGRDSSPHTNHDVRAAEAICNVVPIGAQQCVRGFVADVTLLYVDPEVGLETCKQVTAPNKPGCYEEFAFQSRGIVGKDELAAVCAQSEDGYEDDCLRGARM